MHPRRPLTSNSCPGQPKSRQFAGGHASTLPVRSPSSPSVTFAPKSHMAATVGSAPAVHLSKGVPFFKLRGLVRHDLLLPHSAAPEIGEARTALAAVHLIRAHTLARRARRSRHLHGAYEGRAGTHAVADGKRDVVSTRHLRVDPALRHAPLGELVLDSVGAAGENVRGEVALLRVCRCRAAVAHVGQPGELCAHRVGPKL
eukprot:1183842-Prorocentrum_minimum.AAC.7